MAPLPGLPNVFYSTEEDCKKRCNLLPVELKRFIDTFLEWKEQSIPYSKSSLAQIPLLPQERTELSKQVLAFLKPAFQETIQKHPYLSDSLYTIYSAPLTLVVEKYRSH
jgi:type I restriction-modification system DNA methylase subunit